MKPWLFAALLLAFPAQAAIAGGDNGGSKSNPKIWVVNDTDEVIGVGVDIDLNRVGNANDPQDDFLDQGGKILNPGQRAQFKVKAGDHMVYAAFPAAIEFLDPTLVASEDLDDLEKGETVRLYVVNDDGDDTPEFED